MTVTIASVSKMFCYNRNLASGIMFAGGSIGSMVYPVIFRILTDAYSVRGTLFVLAGILFNYIIVIFLLRKDPNDLAPQNKTFVNSSIDILKHPHQYLNPTFSLPDKEEHTISKHERSTETTKSSVTILNVSSLPDDVHHSKDKTLPKKKGKIIKEIMVICKPEFLFIACYHASYTIGFYGFLMYAPPYIEEKGLTNLQLSLLLTVSAAANMVGRFCIGFLGNLAYTNIYILACTCMLIVGTVTILLPSLINVGGSLPILFFQMVLHGFIGGGISPLQPQMVVNALGAEHSGKGIGFLSVTFSLGTSVPPVLFGKQNIIYI